jgi:hypothetical protein
MKFLVPNNVYSIIISNWIFLPFYSLPILYFVAGNFICADYLFVGTSVPVMCDILE